MSKFQQWQISLVNFDPSFGHEYKKIRPALITQNDRYIESGKLLTVIPISSQTAKQTELDILLKSWGGNALFALGSIKWGWTPKYALCANPHLEAVFISC